MTILSRHLYKYVPILGHCVWVARYNVHAYSTDDIFVVTMRKVTYMYQIGLSRLNTIIA